MDLTKHIQNKKDFLITTHIAPDGDAICTELAVANLLEKLGKNVFIVNDNVVPDHYKFLKGTEKIVPYDQHKKRDFDAVIIVDCPTLQRIGRVKELLDDHYVINIDHHISNEAFADISFVDPDASSAAEVVYMMYKQMNVPLDKDVARYIYIAMLTDTGSFNYSNTNAKTHRIVAELLEFNIKPYEISVNIHANKSVCDLQLLGMVLGTLSVFLDGKIAYIVCTNEMLEKTGSDISATENFVNYARSIKTAKVGLFIRQNTKDPSMYKISLRTKDNVSATKIASVFGGGGHVHAAGCTIKGELQEIKQKLFEAAAVELKN